MRLSPAVVLTMALAGVLGSSAPTPVDPAGVARSQVHSSGTASSARHLGFDDLGFDNLGPTETVSMSTPLLPRATVVAAPVARPPEAADAVLGTPGSGPAQEALVQAYLRAVAAASSACHVRPQVLAAIGQVESGSAGGRTLDASHRVVPAIYGPVLSGGRFAAIADTDGGRLDGDSHWDRAVGPMQFIPGTWATSGVDGDGDGVADPQNVFDAAASAAGYLCHAGRDLSKRADLDTAILSYNHSQPYLASVLAWISYFDQHGLDSIGSVSFAVVTGADTSVTAAMLTAPTNTGGPTLPQWTPAASSPTPSTATPATTTTTPTTTTPSPTTTITTTPTTTTSPTTTTPSPTTTSTRSSSPTTTTPSSSPTTTTPSSSPTTTTPSPTTTTPSPTTTTTAPVVVEPGMVVTVSSDGQDDLTFFLGDASDNRNPDRAVYSVDSPLGHAVNGKAVGDTVSFQNRAGATVTVRIEGALPQGK
jgi:membrane-bound lytic murein transglycosylase B